MLERRSRLTTSLDLKWRHYTSIWVKIKSGGKRFGCPAGLVGFNTERFQIVGTILFSRNGNIDISATYGEFH